MKDVQSTKTFIMILVIFLCAISLANCRLPEDLPPGTKVYMDYQQLEDFLTRDVYHELDIEVLPVPQWKVKPKQIQVLNSYVAKLFGGEQVIGMKFDLDPDTQLYIPPAANGYITENDRIDLMWFNKDTYQNFCTQRIGKIDFIHSIMSGFRVTCTDDFNRDKCCGKEDSCLCLKASVACACISEKDNERRKQMMSEFHDMYDAVEAKVEEIASKVAKVP